jgi:hypothetical protein
LHKRTTKKRNRHTKKKVKWKVLSVHNHQRTKVYGNGGIIPGILSVARTGDWADPKSGLDAAAKRTTER